MGIQVISACLNAAFKRGFFVGSEKGMLEV